MYKNKNLKRQKTLADLPSRTLLLGVREELGVCPQVAEPTLQEQDYSTVS